MRPRSGDGPRGDLVEAPEQVAMTARGEAGEVVRPGVNRVEKRRLRVDEPVRAQYAVDLVHDGPRGEDVLEDGLHDDGVDRLRPQRYPVRVGDELHERRRADIEGDHPLRPVAVNRLDAVPDPAAADDEDGGGWPRQRRQIGRAA